MQQFFYAQQSSTSQESRTHLIFRNLNDGSLPLQHYTTIPPENTPVNLTAIGRLQSSAVTCVRNILLACALLLIKRNETFHYNFPFVLWAVVLKISYLRMAFYRWYSNGRVLILGLNGISALIIVFWRKSYWPSLESVYWLGFLCNLGSVAQ